MPLIALWAIVNPFGAVPLFVALTATSSTAERKKIAKIVVIAVFSPMSSKISAETITLARLMLEI